MRVSNRTEVHRLAIVGPAPPQPASGASMAVWIWFGLALAIVVIGGYILASRR